MVELVPVKVIVHAAARLVPPDVGHVQGCTAPRGLLEGVAQGHLGERRPVDADHHSMGGRTRVGFMDDDDRAARISDDLLRDRPEDRANDAAVTTSTTTTVSALKLKDNQGTCRVVQPALHGHDQSRRLVAGSVGGIREHHVRRTLSLVRHGLERLW